jgi:hypothetical protein
MIDFYGYLVDSSEVICITPVREGGIGDLFFIVNFRGGSNQSFPAEHRDEFVALVKMTYAARQIPDDDLA